MRDMKRQKARWDAEALLVVGDGDLMEALETDPEDGSAAEEEELLEVARKSGDLGLVWRHDLVR